MNYLEFSLFCRDPQNYIPISNISISQFPRLRKKITNNGTGVIELEMEGDKNNVLVIYTHHFNIIRSQKINLGFPYTEWELSRLETVELLKQYFPVESDMEILKEPCDF